MSVFPGGRLRAGFTLIELMVSVAVLALLVVFIGSVINATSDTALRTHKRMEADAEARLVLDRIGFDIGNMIRRADVDYLFNDGLGSDRMAFYSAIPSHDATRPMSVVAYRQEADRLERAAIPLAWDEMAFRPRTLRDTWPEVTAAGASDAFEILGAQTLGMEVRYQTDAPELVATPPAAADSVPVRSVRAVVVTIAILDPRSAQTVDGEARRRLGEVFVAPPDGADTAVHWNNIIDGKTSVAYPPAGVPAAAARSVKIYQRRYVLR